MVAIIVLIVGTATPTTSAAGTALDYAPSGMPDFSQCRTEWSRPASAPGRPAQWTHAGPVALANALWWLDSRWEPDPQPPVTVSDGFALITSYPRFGPRIDDHDPRNLSPLVQELASRVRTDGRDGRGQINGTGWEHFVTGTHDYVNRRKVQDTLGVDARLRPDADWLIDHLDTGAAIILLLGIWEGTATPPVWNAPSQQGSPEIQRTGGHYVSVAEISTLPGSADIRIEISDPLLDSAAAGGPGRIVPPDPRFHSCRQAAREHDDAAFVSHDAYETAPATVPGGGLEVTRFFTAETVHQRAAFAGLNPLGDDRPETLEGSSGVGGRVATTPVVIIDAALAIHPRDGLRPPLDASTEIPPTATVSSGGSSPTHVTPTGTATATASPPPVPSSSPTAVQPKPRFTPTPTVRVLPAPTGAVPIGYYEALLPIAVSQRR